jgi:Flp pilus assembly protein TadG
MAHRRTVPSLSPIRRPGMRFRRGTATVELGLVSPLLVLFALAACDLGRISYGYAVVSNAARCGADQGASHGFSTDTKADWEAEIRATVAREMASFPSFDAAQLEVDVTTEVIGPSLFRVTVEVGYPFVTAIDWTGLPHRVPLSHSVTARRIK